jgi:hypothetical protein
MENGIVVVENELFFKKKEKKMVELFSYHMYHYVISIQILIVFCVCNHNRENANVAHASKLENQKFDIPFLLGFCYFFFVECLFIENR